VRSPHSDYAIRWLVGGTIPAGTRHFSPKPTKPSVVPTQPPTLWVPTDISRVKQSRCELDHKPPRSAQVKNEWSYTSNLPICLHGVDRDNSAFNRVLKVITECYAFKRDIPTEINLDGRWTWYAEKETPSSQEHESTGSTANNSFIRLCLWVIIFIIWINKQ
jgi:hypothetical protein